MMKKRLSVFLAAAMVLSLAACGGGKDTADGGAGDTAAAGAESGAEAGGSNESSDEVIKLSLWGGESDQEYLAERIEAFKAAYPDQNFDISLGVESESTAKDTILTDVQAAADVYAFASDQTTDLVNAGALLPLDTVEEALTNVAGKSLADIKAENVSGSIDAVTINGQMYAFPFAMDGYFMFYDSDFVSAEQAQNWETLLDAAEASGKKVGMVLASGWYDASFFYGAGFTTGLNEDGTTSIDWNGTSPSGVSGVQVVKAMQKIAGHPAFMAIADGDIANQIAGGSLCAVISGTWDTEVVEANFGEDYVAGKMPVYTTEDGKEVQTGSVSSYKCIGVNPYAVNSGWAVILAEFLTNEESQVARYEARSLAPSNIAAASADTVMTNKGVVGLTEQAQFGVVQLVGGKYWDPAKSFGEQIAQGTLPSDDAGIQAALDELVTGITSPIS